jgi:8-oxo-dGTP diphosphatase
MKTVAVGIIVRGGLVLACQRRRDAVYSLKWEFPGGKIEPGEPPATALRRELREELDIDASVGEEFHRQEWIYPDGVEDPKKDGSFRVHYFLVEHFTGDPVNKAFEQIRWVTLHELSTLDILEGNRETVNLLATHDLSRSVS